MVAGGPDEGMSGQADKGITAKTFTAQYGLHQAAITSALGAVMGQLQINRQGGIQVGVGFRNDGNTVVAFCGQGVELYLGHAKPFSVEVIPERRPGNHKKTRSLSGTG